MIDPIQSASALCDPWFAAILRASIQGGVALAAASLFCRMLPKIPAALKCWVLRLAFLKLLLAFILWAPIEVPVLRPITAASAPGNAAIARSTTNAGERREIVPVVSANVAPPLSARPDPRLAWLALWSAGVVGALLLVGKDGLATARFRAQCAALQDDPLNGAYWDIAGRLGVARPPPLLNCDAGGTPMLIGLFRQAVVVPRGIRASCDDAQIRLMLAHELAHYRRHDLWWAWLPTACRILFWFHPLVWIANRAWHFSQESASDQAAISAIHATPAEYGRVLIHAMDRSLAAPLRLAALPVIGSRRHIERRLLAMTHFTFWPRRRWLAAGMALVCLGTIGLVPWRLAAQARPAGSHTLAPRAPSTQQASSSSSQPAGRRRNMSNALLVEGRLFCPTAEITPLADGSVSRLMVVPGQPVKKGAVIVQLDDRRAVPELARAAVALHLAEAQLKNATALQFQHATSRIEVESRRAELAAARAEYQLAQAQLEDTRLLTPIDGIVTRLPDAGQFVAEGKPVAEVVNTAAQLVRVQVPLELANSLTPGDEFEVFGPGPADPANPHPAQIDFVSPVVSSSTGSVEVTGWLKSAAPDLRCGMAVRVEFQRPGK